MRWAAAVVAPLVLLAACSGGNSTANDRRVRVLAAASLTEAFTDIGNAFEQEHPGARVTLDFGASSTLAQQIVAGAPGDVFASADETTMDTVVRARAASSPRPFARNRATLLVARGNPHRISSLADVTRPGIVFVTCAPAVPCGRIARRALSRAGVDARPASLEPDVKAVVAKVTLGEADAGIVYETDARAAATKASAVPIADAPYTTYPIAALRDAGDRGIARQFVDFVLSGEGRRVLAGRGFLAP